jgi:CBS domain-containing protein
MKNISEIMSSDVAWATPDTSLVDIAKKMVSADCGEIPVVQGSDQRRILGVITDRDIVCRTIGMGKNPMDCYARDIMTQRVITGTVDMSIQDAMDLMTKNQVRRLPIVDKNQFLCGMISQADLVGFLNEDAATNLVQNVSRPSDSPSAVQ